MKVNDFNNYLESLKQAYIKEKIENYIKQGHSKAQAANKANQSWRTYVGSKLQSLIYEYLEKELKPFGLQLTSDKYLNRQNLPLDLELLKRKLAISYGRYLFLPDSDIIIYKKTKNDIKIIAIISIKKSFRERGFVIAYWALKLKSAPITKHIKNLLVSPDVDDEISFVAPNNKPRKMRVILEHELDGIFLIKDDFEKTKNVYHFKDLVDFIVKSAKSI